MTAAKRKSATDDKVEAKRKIIRRSLDEIIAEVEATLRNADLRHPINIVVPSRHSLVTIASSRDLPPDEWSRMFAIVREVLSRKLGAKGLRGRPLTSGMAKVTTDAAADIVFDTRS